jgi:hypothetical protein
MDDKQSLIETLFEKTKQYIDTSIELVKLRAIDKISELMANLLSKLAIFLVFIIFFIFANIGLSIWVGEILGKIWLGFFAVSGFYAFIGIMLIIFGKKWLKTPISNFIINNLLD